MDSSSPSVAINPPRGYRLVCTTTLSILLVAASRRSAAVVAFSSPIFQKTATLQRTAPSKTEGVEIELPDFDEMFGRIQAVSPLARLAIQGGGTGEGGGFAAVEETSPAAGTKWKNVSKNKRKLVHQIDRVDNFQGLGPPLLRWRASMEGLCHGGKFAEFIMDKERRQSWDPQIDNVVNLYPINDLDAANIAMGSKFGDCEKLGVGYTLTQHHPIGISPREQLTLCGIQEFEDGSSLIWGTELEEWHDHLMPQGRERMERARSHLFSIALIPTGDRSFDVEYSLHLDFGGSMPHWLTANIILDSVKGMFSVAQPFFNAGEDSELHKFIREERIQKERIEDRNSILFTP